jgi:hydrogenase/urease accessory protein HupE
VDVYEGKALKREIIFDTNSPQQDYVLGSRQSVISVIRQFLIQGVIHIFTGPDHILFIVGLLLLGGTLEQLLKIVTAFTVAHSVTLCLATLNILHPSARLIEPAIALSIVFVGLHSMATRQKRSGEKPPLDMRLLFAFVFGFIHGFGFAYAPQELELPRQALVAALFSFNLGVECGQACIVLVVAPFLALLHRKSDRFAHRVVTAGSLAVIAAGAFWFVQRVLAG